MYLLAECVWCTQAWMQIFFICVCSAHPASHMSISFTKLTTCFNTLLLLLVDRGHCRKTVEGSTAIQSLISRGRSFQFGQAKGHFLWVHQAVFVFLTNEHVISVLFTLQT